MTTIETNAVEQKILWAITFVATAEVANRIKKAAWAVDGYLEGGNGTYVQVIDSDSFYKNNHSVEFKMVPTK